jgi:hypothetical protein
VYDLRGDDNATVLRTFVVGSEGLKIERFRGSVAPFAGWQVVEGVPRPTDAIVVERPSSEGWSVVGWILEHSGKNEMTGRPRMDAWGGPERWRVVIPGSLTELGIRRDGNRIYIEDGGTVGGKEALFLMEGPIVSEDQHEIQRAYQVAATKYPRFRELIEYRSKVTYLLLAIWVFQGVSLGVYSRTGGRYVRGVEVGTSLAWVGGGMWLILVYFQN